MHIRDLSTLALIIDAAAFDSNLATMASALPGAALRPHVKAHKCTSLAAAQAGIGHRSFTCATPREVVGMAAAGLGTDLLLANETIDPTRLTVLAAAQDLAAITIAVDSVETLAAARTAGIRRVLIDVNVGLPRCGCAPADAGRLADQARTAGIEVRGVMGYEGHLMMVADRAEKQAKVDAAMALLLAAHADVGGEIVSAGGTGTYDLHTVGTDAVTEIQAGSYALMDTQYSTLGLPFAPACFVVGTIISVGSKHAVADVGLKSLGMDHGNPALAVRTSLNDEGTPADVWFCSDEHITFGTSAGVSVGGRVFVTPAHIDPTMAMHDTAWVGRGDEVVDRWPIDLRGW
jgi:D-serine deaminase-like pyridoxal phosphate-dependent protein